MSENPSPTDAQPVTPELSDALGEELYGATPGQIEGLKSALASGDADQCLAISHGLHGADLADMVEDLSSLERHRLIDVAGPTAGLVDFLKSNHLGFAVVDDLCLALKRDGPIHSGRMSHVE